MFSAVRSAADDKISCSFRYIADDQRVGASADVKYIAGECSFVTTHVLSSLWDQIGLIVQNFLFSLFCNKESKMTDDFIAEWIS